MNALCCLAGKWIRNIDRALASLRCVRAWLNVVRKTCRLHLEPTDASAPQLDDSIRTTVDQKHMNQHSKLSSVVLIESDASALPLELRLVLIAKRWMQWFNYNFLFKEMKFFSKCLLNQDIQKSGSEACLSNKNYDKLKNHKALLISRLLLFITVANNLCCILQWFYLFMYSQLCTLNTYNVKFDENKKQNTQLVRTRRLNIKQQLTGIPKNKVGCIW